MNAGVKVDGVVWRVKEKGVCVNTDRVWEDVIGWAVGWCKA
jgi:hypothetical protein